MNKTKKSLLASGLSLLVCAALLVGTTFAWFTDSVNNKGNSIQAGSLLINAYAYKLGTGGQTCTIPGVNGDQAFTFTATPQDLKTDSTPIINEPMWEPGASSAKLLQVANDGTLAAKISLQFATSGDLTDALWFDFIQIDENGDTVGQFTQRPMNTLATFAENLELPLDTGATVRFVLVYGMYETAGSEYMGDSFTADVTILATQNTKEADGFGNIDYDKNATYPACDNSSFVSGMEKGGSVSAKGAFDWINAVNMQNDTQTVLNLEEDALITVTKDGIIDLTDNATLTVQGSGTLEQNMESEIGYLMRAADSSKVIIEDGTYISGLTCIQAGDNAQVEIYGGHFEALVNWNGTYWLLNLIDQSQASITVYGGTFVNFDPSNSKTEAPAANFVADGYKVVSEEKDNGDIWYTVVPE